MKVELAKAFMRRALEDLDSAKILLEKGKHADSVYHAEQASQKGMKAVLILFGTEVLEHRVSHLFKDKVCVQYPELEGVAEIASRVEDHWLRPRYPIATRRGLLDPLEIYDEKLATSVLRDAEKVVEKLREFLEEEFDLRV